MGTNLGRHRPGAGSVLKENMMRLVSRLNSLWRNLFRKQRIDRELDEEVRSYVELLTEEKIKAGMTAQEAHRQARIELGGAEQVKEEMRGVRAAAWFDSLLRDVRYAQRTLRKNPTFAVIAILTLALGIGATTAIFSVVDAVLLQPLPIRDPDRVVVLHDQLPIFNMPRTKVSPLQFREFSQRTDLFDASAALKAISLTLTGQGQAIRLQTMQTTAGLFPLLGVEAILGRVFTNYDDTFGNPHVVLLSERLWRQMFEIDRGAIGKRLQLDGNSYEIVGVLPERLDALYPHTEIWVPAAISPESVAEKYRWYVDYSMLARLRSGVSIDQARLGMRAALASFNENDFNFGVEIRPILEEEVGDVRGPLYILMGAVALVLLIACTNVGNLLLARNAARGREIAIRAALGAGRGRIVTQLLTESLLLSVIGGVAGLLLARACVFALIWIAPADLPHVGAIRLDASVLAFALGLSFVAAVLFGLAPAIAATRADVAEPLRKGAARSQDRERHRLTRALVVSEIAIALVLLLGSGLLLQSFAKLLDVPLGFDPDNVLTARLSLSPAISGDPAQFSNALVERISALPGVRNAAIATGAPFTSDGYGTTFDIRDHQAASNEPVPHAAVLYVTPGYFETLRVPLIGGRFFTLADMRAKNWLDKSAVRIIDQTLAKRFWHDRDPIGAQIGNDGQWATIVGVVGTVRDRDLATEPQGTIYVPGYGGSTLVLRSASNLKPFIAAVREQVRALSPEVPVYDSQAMRELVAVSLARRRFAATLLTFFAALALVLSFIGVYGVIAYLVTQRTHEIGLRMALGAQRGELLRMVLGRGLMMAMWGVVLGLVGSLAVKPVLASQLFGIGPSDLFSLFFASLLLMVVAVVATYVPARRVTHVDPMVALRHE
jgi:predicted permease